MKSNKKQTDINSNGVNIIESIEGELNFDILAGWWSVFHQSTDHLIIGRFTIPIRVKMAAFLSPFEISSYALEIIECAM